MHAGDALWYMYAGLAVLDRKHSDDPDYLILIQRMRECTGVIGTHIGVPEPPSTKLDELVDQLMLQDTAPSIDPFDPPDETPRPDERPKTNNYSSEENIGFARTLLDEMVASGEFDWSEFVTDLHDRLHKPDSFFTPKQWRGIIRTARKNDDFWDDFEMDNPECVDYGEQMVIEAGK